MSKSDGLYRVFPNTWRSCFPPPPSLSFESEREGHSHLSDSLQPHGPQHARPPCPSPTPRACSNSCPLGWWCHPTISSSVVPFSFRLQSFPASGSFPMSQFFTSGGQSTGVSASASVLPMNIQGWFPLGGTGWISLQSKGLSRVFSDTTYNILWSVPIFRYRNVPARMLNILWWWTKQKISPHPWGSYI